MNSNANREILANEEQKQVKLQRELDLEEKIKSLEKKYEKATAEISHLKCKETKKSKSFEPKAGSDIYIINIFVLHTIHSFILENFIYFKEHQKN